MVTTNSLDIIIWLFCFFCAGLILKRLLQKKPLTLSPLTLFQSVTYALFWIMMSLLSYWFIFNALTEPNLQLPFYAHAHCLLPIGALMLLVLKGFPFRIFIDALRAK